jgi:hypothetical protein
MVLGNTQAAVFDKSTWCGFLALLHEFYDFTLHNHLGFCLLISKVVIVNWTLYDYIWKSAPSRQLHCFLFHSLFYSWLNSFFFLNEIGVWTQGFALALTKQVLYYLNHSSRPSPSFSKGRHRKMRDYCIMIISVVGDLVEMVGLGSTSQCIGRRMVPIPILFSQSSIPFLFKNPGYPKFHHFSLTVFCRYLRVSLTPQCIKWPVDWRRGSASLVGMPCSLPHATKTCYKKQLAPKLWSSPFFLLHSHHQLSLPYQSSFLTVFVPALS